MACHEPIEAQQQGGWGQVAVCWQHKSKVRRGVDLAKWRTVLVTDQTAARKQLLGTELGGIQRLRCVPWRWLLQTLVSTASALYDHAPLEARRHETRLDMDRFDRQLTCAYLHAPDSYKAARSTTYSCCDLAHPMGPATATCDACIPYRHDAFLQATGRT